MTTFSLCFLNVRHCADALVDVVEDDLQEPHGQQLQWRDTPKHRAETDQYLTLISGI